MTADQEKLEEFFCREMREHPENVMWFWRKFIRLADGAPVPEAALREFWGIAPGTVCPD